jgi:general secretion pathway protein I
MKQSRQAGFTLLEAVVALAILAAVLIPLYTLVGGAMQSMLRARDASERAANELNLLAALATINPAQRPQGQMQLGDLVLSWQAREVVAPVRGAGYPAGASSFEVGLYDVDAVLRDAAGRAAAQRTARRVGWR